MQLVRGGMAVRTSALGALGRKSGSSQFQCSFCGSMARGLPQGCGGGADPLLMPGCCAGPHRGPPALPRAVPGRRVQAHGAVLGLRARAAAQLQHHLPGAAEHPEAASVRPGPLPEPAASAGRITPPSQPQLTVWGSSWRFWTPPQAPGPVLPAGRCSGSAASPCSCPGPLSQAEPINHSCPPSALACAPLGRAGLRTDRASVLHP